jgi:tetratricopeptide (TPR) repeat protein
LRGEEKSAANVGARLGATHVLDGSVRKASGRVRITAQLVECATQTLMWSDRFDRDLSDVFALQDEIAQAVAAALKSTFAPLERGTVDPVVHDLYLRARELTPDVFSYDARLLKEALERAPDFLPAWEALLYNEAVNARFGHFPEEIPRYLASMEAAAERVLALDPESVAPLRVRAMTAPHCGAFAESERLINLCLARRGTEPLDLIHAAGAASNVGRNRLALSYAQQAFSLDPLDLVTYTVHAIYQLGVGNWEEAKARFDEGHRLWPDGAWLRTSAAVSAIQMEDWPQFDHWVGMPGDFGLYRGWVQSLVAYAQAARTSNNGLAEATLAGMRASLDATGRVSLSSLGRLCRAGLADDAFAVVEAADFSPYFRRGVPMASPDVGISCLFGVDQKALRADPRFLQLCARLGLCEYWVGTGQWPDCADEVDYDFRALATGLVRT